MKTGFPFGFLVLLTAFLLTGCQKDQEVPTAASDDLKGGGGAIKIAVLSDFHYMAPEILWSDGPAFQAYLAQDPKLVEYSRVIFLKAIAQINKDRPNILLLPGDMTKDGEYLDHIQVINLLRRNLDQSIKMFVIPGNHDIDNPHAVYYDGSNTVPARRVSATEFTSLYFDFGYQDAISRDPASLSYVAEPFRNLRLLAIDATQPASPTAPTTNGAIKPETMTWITAQVLAAQQKNMQVVAMMHHNLVPHYTNQQYIDPGYVLDNWTQAVDLLTSLGVKVIFTGHYHSSDITKYTTSFGTIFDIEAGSPVTYPVSYRLVKYFDNDHVIVETKYIRGINIEGVPLEVYAKDFLETHLDYLFEQKLIAEMPTVPEPYRTQVADQAAPLLRKAYMAHTSGNENITPNEMADINSFRSRCGVPGLGDEVYGITMAFWTDLPIEDNYVEINLNSN